MEGETVQAAEIVESRRNTGILHKWWNIFGGFTLLKWESRVWNGKYGKENNTSEADNSQKSFVFTLQNPHNVPARKFPLKAECKHTEISCDSKCGPFFVGGFSVSDNWNTNDTGLNGETFLTGSKNFQVTEIEVFEIVDETTLPHKLSKAQDKWDKRQKRKLRENHRNREIGSN
jgi:hypothetical protein